MFDIPDAKRIKRSELSPQSRSRSTSSAADSKADAEIEKALQDRLSALYGPLDPSPAESQSADQETGEEEPEQENEFEFRLFSNPTTNPNPNSTTSPSKPTPIQKIILHDSDLEDNGTSEGRFLHPRPRTHYFHSPAQGELKNQYFFAALSGQDVLERAKGRAWGLECPWRVKTITVRSIPSKKKTGRIIQIETSGSKDAGAVGERGDKGKKTKPNKKRRIILRERERVKTVKEEEKKRVEVEREEKEREKRTRRNREKKVKRKLKEKAKKAGVGGDVDGGDGAGSRGDVEMDSVDAAGVVAGDNEDD